MLNQQISHLCWVESSSSSFSYQKHKCIFRLKVKSLLLFCLVRRFDVCDARVTNSRWILLICRLFTQPLWKVKSKKKKKKFALLTKHVFHHKIFTKKTTKTKNKHSKCRIRLYSTRLEACMRECLITVPLEFVRSSFVTRVYTHLKALLLARKRNNMRRE